jgi:hypothetical protein
MITGIYKIESLVYPDRCYIGSSYNIKKRFREHIRSLKIKEYSLIYF